MSEQTDINPLEAAFQVAFAVVGALVISRLAAQVAYKMMMRNYEKALMERDARISERIADDMADTLAKNREESP